MHGTVAGPSDGGHFWLRWRAGWHLLAAVTAGLVATVSAIEQATPVRRGAVIVLFAVLLGWYALVGARALNRVGDRRGVSYFAGVAVVLTVVYALTTTAAFLLFMLMPQVFAMLGAWTSRLAVLTVLYGQLVAFTAYPMGFSGHAVAVAGLGALLSILVGSLIGAYISGIVKQSRRRAELIEELTRTRAQLAAERHQAGVYAERQRLAAEIHDTLTQGFTSILMLTQAVRVGLDQGRDTVEEQLRLIEHTARENVTESRALVAALSPPDLADRGLLEALTRLADRHTRETGVPVEVAVTGIGPGHRSASAAAIEVVLYRTAQEALANIRRHAAATAVRIELSHQIGAMTLEVTDDGQGFDLARVDQGYGLAGLRGRATAFGGTCEVRSAPDAGTRVRVCLPWAGA